MNPGPSRYVIFNPPCQSSGALSPPSRLRKEEKEKLIDGAEDLTIQIHTLCSAHHWKITSLSLCSHFSPRKMVNSRYRKSFNLRIILNFQNVLGPSYSWKLIITVSLDTKDKMENQPRLKKSPSEFNFGI